MRLVLAIAMGMAVATSVCAAPMDELFEDYGTCYAAQYGDAHLAAHPKLAALALREVLRVLFGWQRRRGGLFVRDGPHPNACPRFAPQAPPSDGEVCGLLERIIVRITRLLQRHGYLEPARKFGPPAVEVSARRWPGREEAVVLRLAASLSTTASSGLIPQGRGRAAWPTRVPAC